MRNKLVLSAFLVLILTSVLAVSAYAEDNVMYAALDSASAVTVATEIDQSTMEYTCYPSLGVDVSGNVILTGTPVTVNYSNSASYAGYYWQDTATGKIYKVGQCLKVTEINDVAETSYYIPTYSAAVAVSFPGTVYSSVDVSSGTPTVCGTAGGISATYPNAQYPYAYASFSDGVYLITSVPAYYSLFGGTVYGCKVSATSVSGTVSGGSVKFNSTTSNFSFLGRDFVTSYDALSVSNNSVHVSGSQTYESPIGRYMYGEDGKLYKVIFQCGSQYFVNDDVTRYSFQGVLVSFGAAATYTDTYSWQFYPVDIYTITFDSQLGYISPISATVICGSTYETLPAATRTGYTFNGWFTETGGSGTQILSTSSVNISANTTLYASWTANTYAVTFDPQSGNVSQTTSLVTYDSIYGSLPTPTRTGYTFNGWFTGTGGAGTQILSSSTVSITEATTLYAAWTANTYSVSFDPQEGTVSQTSLTVTYDSVYGSLPIPTRTGYTFSGWFTGTDGSGTLIQNTSTVSITSDTTLYASWTINQYTVNFESNGGSSVSSITQDYSTTVTEPADPTKTGYTFRGWFTDSALTSAVAWPFNIGASDITLYAAWKVNQYTVSFESNGGSSVASITQDYNTAVAEPTAPTKTGYTFSGWFADSALTNALTWPMTIGASDAELYAAWTINQYTVSFESDGGSIITSITQDYNTSVTKPTDPTKTGYTFSGWYADSELKTTVLWPITIGASDSTLYASWTINQYTVSFDSKGGSSVAAVTQDYNTTANEPDNPTRSGHTFAGWFTDSELTNAASWPITIGASDITLYAAWTVNPYTISFESNGGSDVASITQEYGTSLNEPEAPMRSGYTFAGWYSDSELNNAIIWPLIIGAEDASLYAKWTANPYTVSFESNGGSDVASITQDCGTTMPEPDKPTRSGYTFGGWYKDLDLKNAVTWPLTIGATDITLYASWTVISVIIPIPNYTVSFDSNDGSTVISQTLVSGDKLEEPPTPTRDGYVFDGWYMDSACTIPWDFSETVTGNVTLYAKWSADASKNIYIVSFKSNGVIIGEQTVSYGKTVQMPSEPTRKGYEFAGWFKDTSLTSPWIFFKDVVTDNITLYAKWVLESNVKKPDNLPYENNCTPVVKTSSTNDEDQDLDSQSNDERNQEFEIIGGNKKDDVGAKNTATTEVSTDTYSLKNILLFSGAAIVAILILILLVSVIYSRLLMLGEKKVYFYEHDSLICSANIRRDKVNITKAISKASGRMLKVKINEGYIDKAYGRDIDFYFKGKPIGTMTIDGDNSFDIAIN